MDKASAICRTNKLSDGPDANVEEWKKNRIEHEHQLEVDVEPKLELKPKMKTYRKSRQNEHVGRFGFVGCAGAGIGEAFTERLLLVFDCR